MRITINNLFHPPKSSFVSNHRSISSIFVNAWVFLLLAISTSSLIVDKRKKNKINPRFHQSVRAPNFMQRYVGKYQKKKGTWFCKSSRICCRHWMRRCVSEAAGRTKLWRFDTDPLSRHITKVLLEDPNVSWSSLAPQNRFISKRWNPCSPLCRKLAYRQIPQFISVYHFHETSGSSRIAKGLKYTGNIPSLHQTAGVFNTLRNCLDGPIWVIDMCLLSITAMKFQWIRFWGMAHTRQTHKNVWCPGIANDPHLLGHSSRTFEKTMAKKKQFI